MSTCLSLLRPRPYFRLAIVSVSTSRFNFSSSHPKNSGKELASDAQKRHDGLRISNTTVYPRITPSNNVISPQAFRKRYENLEPNIIVDSDLVTIRGTLELPLLVLSKLTLLGRINSIRESSTKLIFIDIVQDKHQVQGVCELSTLQRGGSIVGENFPSSLRALRRGDIISRARFV